MKDLPVTVGAVRDAAAAIAEAIARSPMIEAPALSELAGTEIHLKIETPSQSRSTGIRLKTGFANSAACARPHCH